MTHSSFLAFGQRAAIAALFAIVSATWVQAQTASSNSTPNNTNNSASGAKDTAKDSAKSASNTAKDTAKGTSDQAAQGANSATGSARESANSAKSQAAKDANSAKSSAQEAGRDARSTAKDTARDARETARDARDQTRDSARDARDQSRESARDARDSYGRQSSGQQDRSASQDSRNSSRDRDTTSDRSMNRDSDSRDSNYSRDSNSNRERDTSRDRDYSQDRNSNYNRDNSSYGRDNSNYGRDNTNYSRDRDSTRDRDYSRDNNNYSRDNDRNRDLNQDRDNYRNRDYDRDRDFTRDRDYSRENRDSYTSRESSSSRGTFRGSDLRSADIGLWFNRSSRDGLVISDISSKGGIARLGLREGDQIVSVNGYRVNGESDFMRYLLDDESRNDRVKVIVSRDGQEQVVWVEPAVLMQDYQYVENDPVEHFGVVLDDRYDDRIVVWKVIPQSPAYYAGIRAGDVFTTFRGQPVSTRQEFVRYFSNLNEGNVPVQVRRGGRVRDFAVDVPRFEARSERRTAMRPNYDAGQAFERQNYRNEQFQGGQYQNENRMDTRQQNRTENRNEGRGIGILPRNR